MDETPYATLGTAGYSWASTFPTFRSTPAVQIRGSLQDFLKEVSAEQVRAWDLSIPPLQREVSEVLLQESLANDYTAILEYELPLEFRRPDVVLLMGGAVLVLELKGRSFAQRADIDQAAGYVRDLRAYHRECADREVHGAVVLGEASGYVGTDAGIHVLGIDAVNDLAEQLDVQGASVILTSSKFLAADAYRPLPSLVESARSLFESGSLPRIHRAAAATEPALQRISGLIHEAARTKTRRLILLTGVPGSGKTLVGLQVAHARWLDDLAVDRGDGKPSAPAVFLSGNGPLVEVLQYELRTAGGGGKAFVRGVKEHVATYSRSRQPVPPEHVLIFDEAQRAFDAAMVAEKHPDHGDGRSEPEHFIEFAERVPNWCVVIGLIGTGQEIHIGEEGGSIQWRHAVEGSQSGEWIVHVSPDLEPEFAGLGRLTTEPALRLDEELRYHLAEDNHVFVARLLEGAPPEDVRPLAAALERQGYHLRITRDLAEASGYLRARYADDPTARFGLIASSKDRVLPRFGVNNHYQSTKRVHFGPWYADGDSDYLGRSCRALRECVTEFGAQGLELDAALLAWGTDFIRDHEHWSNGHARGYQKMWMVKDPYRLRLNSYRVLLTGSRDATVVFVPPLPILDETYEHLRQCGFRLLSERLAG
jgi:Schlafen group 3, DNA/RNA helicase domain